MADLTNAITLAATMHKGQYDKGGNPYILHPLRVMLNATDDDTRIVAVLHDIVEDTEMTLEGLRELKFSNSVIDAIDHLSRRTEESYDDFIDRVKLNPLVTQVKIWDIEDNSDVSRLNCISVNDRQRLNKYSRALYKLTNGAKGLE